MRDCSGHNSVDKTNEEVVNETEGVGGEGADDGAQSMMASSRTARAARGRAVRWRGERRNDQMQEEEGRPQLEASSHLPKKAWEAQ